MPQPGKFSPRGEDWFVRKFADFERELRELRAANPFGLTGITPQDGGTDFDGYSNFNGDMAVTGDSEFKGDMKVSGTLNLPAGIIGNDALSNPISPLATHVGINNVSLATGANVEKLRATITVPTGYTQALVFTTATMVALNSSAATDTAYLGVKTNGTAIGAASQSTAVAGWPVCLPATGVSLLTGLSDTFPVTATASSGNSAWAANTNNFINMDIMTIFLR